MAYFQDDVLQKTVAIEMPENIVADGQIVSADAMSDFIAEAAKAHDIARKDAAVILPPSLAAVRTVTVPLMSESQLKYNLPYEFKDYLTEDKNKYAIDYEVLETIHDEEGKPTQQRLFACAVLKDVIDRYEMILDRAGFRLKVAVPEEYVYTKLFRGDIGPGNVKEGTYALLDVGQTSSRFYILRNGEFNTKRTVDLGIKVLEEIIAKAKPCDIHLAHNYKMTNYENVLNSEKCVDYYNRLAVELLKAVNFYNYNNRTDELKDIYLIGGGSAIAPLVQALHAVADVTVHSAGELLGSDLEQENSYLLLRAICCGAGE